MLKRISDRIRVSIVSFSFTNTSSSYGVKGSLGHFMLKGLGHRVRIL